MINLKAGKILSFHYNSFWDSYCLSLKSLNTILKPILPLTKHSTHTNKLGQRILFQKIDKHIAGFVKHLSSITYSYLDTPMSKSLSCFSQLPSG